MKTVIVLGDLNVDIILSGIQDDISFGKEVLATNHVKKVGGSAANVASMLSMNGCPTQLFGQVGNDFDGKYLLQSLRESGVKIETISCSVSEPTGITVSLTYSHDRMYISHLGTVASTKLEDLQDGYLIAGAHLHLTSYFLQKGLQPSMGELLQQAKQTGMSTSLDPGGDPSGEWDISCLEKFFQYLDWFMPNADEIMAITKTQEVGKAIDIFSHEVMGVVVKTGADGAIVRHKGTIEHYPGITVKAIDTTCAGDCFDAGFLYGLSNENSVSEAVSLGNKYGAQAVSCVGLPQQKIL